LSNGEDGLFAVRVVWTFSPTVALDAAVAVFRRAPRLLVSPKAARSRHRIRGGARCTGAVLSLPAGGAASPLSAPHAAVRARRAGWPAAVPRAFSVAVPPAVTGPRAGLSRWPTRCGGDLPRSDKSCRLCSCPGDVTGYRRGCGPLDRRRALGVDARPWSPGPTGWRAWLPPAGHNLPVTERDGVSPRGEARLWRTTTGEFRADGSLWGGSSPHASRLLYCGGPAWCSKKEAPTARRWPPGPPASRPWWRPGCHLASRSHRCRPGPQRRIRLADVCLRSPALAVDSPGAATWVLRVSGACLGLPQRGPPMDPVSAYRAGPTCFPPARSGSTTAV